jgi:hypothetical protein
MVLVVLEVLVVDEGSAAVVEGIDAAEGETARTGGGFFVGGAGREWEPPVMSPTSVTSANAASRVPKKRRGFRHTNFTRARFTPHRPLR